MSQLKTRPIALIILDGWGVESGIEPDAFRLANMPNYDEICEQYPRTTLSAAGASVGLAEGAPGNAEVGHMSLGAGSIVYTNASLVDNALKSGQFFNNETLTNAFKKAVDAGKSVHLIGLISDGGINSSSGHLYALLRMAKLQGVANLYVHAILDGRDVPQRTADVYVEALEIKMAEIGIGKIASLCGRYFAMDKEENWERTARAFTMLVHGEGERGNDATNAVRASFLRGISDEFVAPIVLESSPDVPVAQIGGGDLVLFFNHRGDGMRQLVKSLTSSDSAKQEIEAVCLVEYDAMSDLSVAFERTGEQMTLADIFAANGVTNYRISETARFDHVSGLFNGKIGATKSNETHIVVKTPVDDLPFVEPESGSFKITDKLLRAIEAEPEGVFIVNIPCVDISMDGGDGKRIIESIQYVDTCLGGIVAKMRAIGGVAMVTASHNGNSGDGGVPFHLVDDEAKQVKLRDGGALMDVAPTILAYRNIDKPNEMTGNSLLEN